MGQKGYCGKSHTVEKAPDASLSRLLKGGAEVFLEPKAEIAFSSKQSAYHRARSWGDPF